jgi:hypothetical protein
MFGSPSNERFLSEKVMFPSDSTPLRRHPTPLPSTRILNKSGPEISKATKAREILVAALFK